VNTIAYDAKGMFAFDLYDRDSSGLLEEDDLNKMMRDIYGKNADSSHYARQYACFPCISLSFNLVLLV
jgi:Ca2+-binding EF-hand superfamily protein